MHPTVTSLAPRSLSEYTLPRSGSRQALELLIKGLVRMEYRGYDSSGVGILKRGAEGEPNTIQVVKRKGKIVNLKSAVSGGLEGTLGVAHTRWATHGAANDVNAHPHCSPDGQVCVVHNGVIENHALLRSVLQGKGYKFRSETDTEVLCNLIHDVRASAPMLTPEEVVTAALSQVEGAFGIGVIFADQPDVLIGARRGSPLILGIVSDGTEGEGKEGEGKGHEYILASDATAILEYTKRVVYLGEGELVRATRTGMELFSLDVDESGHIHHAGHESAKEVAGVEGGEQAEEGEGEMGGGDGPASGAGHATAGLGVVGRMSPLLKPKPKGDGEAAGGDRKKQARQSLKGLSRRIPEIHRLEMDLQKIERGGHKHFMLKEIFEQPEVLRNCMRGRVDAEAGSIRIGAMSERLPPRAGAGTGGAATGGAGAAAAAAGEGVEVGPTVLERFLAARRLVIVACGTSFHSGLVGEYLIESLARINVEVEYASEFRYRNPLLDENDVVIAVSQSGETADTLAAIRLAQERGALTFGLVNVIGSSIARETDAGAYLRVGPEIGVASTKAFTAQVCVFTMLALLLGKEKGTMSDEDFKAGAAALWAIPDTIERVLTENKGPVMEVSRSFRFAQSFLYLGRGYNYPVALEGALKLKEISYIHAEGYAAAEMKHGPIALIDEFMPVVMILPSSDPTYDKIKSNLAEVRARSGVVICVTEESNEHIDELEALCDSVITVPEVQDWLSPLVTVVPLQLLSYYIADLRGCPVDQPRNLAKAVTVE